MCQQRKKILYRHFLTPRLWKMSNLKPLKNSSKATQPTQQTFALMKTSFVFVVGRCLEDVFKTSSSRWIYCLNHSSLEDNFKTSWSRPVYSSWPYVFKTSSRRLTKTSLRRFQEVFKTSCKNVFDTSLRRLQDVLKTSSRRLQNFFKTSCKSVLKTSSRRLQDVLKISSRRLAKMPSRRWRIIRLNCLPRSRICLGHTFEKFMVSVENLQVW